MNTEDNKVKAWFVWNPDAEEGVVLADKYDAIYAATGRQCNPGVSCIADNFREIYADDDPDIEFEMVNGHIVDGVFIKDSE